MDRPVLSLIACLLAVSTVRGETIYTFTNSTGQLVSTPSYADTSGAIGAVATGTVVVAAVNTAQPSPTEFPDGIWISSTSSYLIVRMPDGHDYAITPTDDGRVIAPQVSFSPLEFDKVPGYVEAEKAKDRNRRQRLLAMKDSPEWSGITNNLAQYETHDDQWQNLRSTATNAIAATTGNNRAALNALLNLAEKERQARDDVKTIANRTKGLLIDLVKDAQ